MVMVMKKMKKIEEKEEGNQFCRGCCYRKVKDSISTDFSPALVLFSDNSRILRDGL